MGNTVKEHTVETALFALFIGSLGEMLQKQSFYVYIRTQQTNKETFIH